MKGGAGQLAFDQPGTGRFYFDKWNEHVEVSKPKISVNNLILGKMYFDIESSTTISGASM